MTDLTPRDDIKAGRRKRKLSQKRLGDLVGCHPQTIDKLERGQIKWSRYTAAIEAQLGLNGATQPQLQEQLPLQRQPERAYGKVNLPLLRSEVTLRASEMFVAIKPIRMTARPPGLEQINEAYAVQVGCNYMEPVYEGGDELFIDPTLRPVPGKDVLLRRSITEDGEAVIGRLETYSDKDWTVTQWNSDGKAGVSKKITFARKDFPICHRVVGKWSR